MGRPIGGITFVRGAAMNNRSYRDLILPIRAARQSVQLSVPYNRSVFHFCTTAAQATHACSLNFRCSCGHKANF